MDALRRIAEIRERIEVNRDKLASVVRVKEICRKLAVDKARKEYGECVDRFEKASEACKGLLENKPIEAAEQFCQVLDIFDQRSVEDNFQRVVRQRVKFIFVLLKQQLVHRLAQVLKEIKWPKTPTSSMIDFSQKNVELVQKLVKLLTRMQLSEYYHITTGKSDKSIFEDSKGSTRDYDPTLWFIDSMLLSFVKSFDFHFSEGRQTYNIEKPEWMFAYAAATIRDHVPFLRDSIQPVVDEMVKSTHPLNVETFSSFSNCSLVFVKKVADCVTKKLKKRFTKIINDRKIDTKIFLKTIDEVIAFDKLVRTSYFFPDELPLISESLLEDNIFEYWLKSEKDFVQSKIDSLFSELNSPWTCISTEALQAVVSENYVFSDLDLDIASFKPSHSIISFLIIVRSICDRYNLIRKMHFRWRFFIEIQVQMLNLYFGELEENLAKLLKKLKSTENNALYENGGIAWKNYCSLLNSSIFLIECLKKWQDDIVFIELQLYSPFAETEDALNSVWTRFNILSTDHKNIDSGIFETNISHLDSMANDFMQSLGRLVVDIFAKGLEGYAKRGHLLNSAFDENTSDHITEELIEPFSNLHLQLQILESSFSRSNFRSVTLNIAHRISEEFRNRIIKGNPFTQLRVQQLATDLKYLFSVFRMFEISPKTGFPELHDDLVYLIDLASDERNKDIKHFTIT